MAIKTRTASLDVFLGRLTACLVVIGLCAALCSAPSLAQQEDSPAAVLGGELAGAVAYVYKTVGSVDLKLYLLLPDGPGPHPAIAESERRRQLRQIERRVERHQSVGN
jgi:hypothetical protein